MSSTQELPTVAIRACNACGSGLLESDKFCRTCGVRQSGLMSLASRTDGDMALTSYVESRPMPRYATAIIEQRPDESDVYRSVSGPLLQAVVAGVSAKPSTRPLSRMGKRAILALLSIPIWLIIVLLSPLDAYAAAKSLSRQM